jgi:hypothetical protein
LKTKLTAEQMVRLSDWLNAGEAMQVGRETVSGTIARLNALAQEGNEEAVKSLIDIGNHIATSLFNLWIVPGKADLQKLIRKIAAERTRFPVSYHSQKTHNNGWKKMVLSLAIGSAGPARVDGNQRSTSDVIDAVLDATINMHEFFLISRVPDEYKELLKLDLVADNAMSLARHIVRIYEMSDPEFKELTSGTGQAFQTLGRNFTKRKDRRKGSLERKRVRSHSNDAVLTPLSVAKAETLQRSADEYWNKRERETLAKMKQTVSDVRTDFVEAVASRLKSRLKSVPKR